MRLALVALFGLVTFCARAAEYPQMGPDIYSPTADASVDIAAALAQARTEGKHVLLAFGANWCIWCHRLDTLLADDPSLAAQLARDFVVVMVDVNSRGGTKRNAATNEKYGNPIQHGLPVLVVLDADDRILVTQETGTLEHGEAHAPAKVGAFLSRWTPVR